MKRGVGYTVNYTQCYNGSPMTDTIKQLRHTHAKPKENINIILVMKGISLNIIQAHLYNYMHIIWLWLYIHNCFVVFNYMLDVDPQMTNATEIKTFVGTSRWEISCQINNNKKIVVDLITFDFGEIWYKECIWQGK